MKGIGRSPREEAEVNYGQHLKEAAKYLLNPKVWNVRWSKILDGFTELICAFVWLLIMILSPITVPLAAYLRMYYAKQRLNKLLEHQAMVDKLHK